jgi:transposase InsO family protein
LIAPAAEPPDLVQREFNPTAPDELWVSDITYVRTWEGWLYSPETLRAAACQPCGAH